MKRHLQKKIVWQFVRRGTTKFANTRLQIYSTFILFSSHRLSCFRKNLIEIISNELHAISCCAGKFIECCKLVLLQQFKMSAKCPRLLMNTNILTVFLIIFCEFYSNRLSITLNFSGERSQNTHMTKSITISMNGLRF